MNKKAIFYAVLAAALYAVSTPFSKLLLSGLSPTMMAALLYLGAGMGVGVMSLIGRASGRRQEQALTRRELPYIIGMVALDIAAPILLMLGLSRTAAANASLLNNFEIVATSLIALALFGERISRRLWAAIALVTLASAALSLEDMSAFSFSAGSLLVLLACCCWGLENNCTRMLSPKDPMQVVIIKGFGSGLGSLAIAAALGQTSGAIRFILPALLLGFVAYGLSIFFYVTAQRYLGAARTSTYYAVAPFIGVLLSMAILGEKPSFIFYGALAVMLAGAYLAATDGKQFPGADGKQSHDAE